MSTTHSFTAIVEPEADGYVAICPELEVAGEGATVEEAMANLREAVELFLESADPTEIERRTRPEFFITRFEAAPPGVREICTRSDPGEEATARRPRAVELTDLPAAEPNMQDVNVVAFDGRVLLFYGASPYVAEGPHGVVVVEFKHPSQWTGGGPNDEALGCHPMARYGLDCYTLHEILDSPAIEAIGDICHKDGKARDRSTGRGERHFLFCFKEGTFECFAEGYHLHGVFESLQAALGAIGNALRTTRPWAKPRPPPPPLPLRDPLVVCREPECGAGAVRFSVFCEKHHLENRAAAATAGRGDLADYRVPNTECASADAECPWRHL